MNAIPCDVIKDLLPSCIDGIASSETERLVGEHVAECEECRTAYDSMRAEINGAEEAEPEKKEIDYLRKNRKRNRRIILFSVLGAAFVILAAVFVKLFVIGSYAEEEALTCSVKVVGKKVMVKGSIDPEGAARVSRIEFSEDNGTVTIKIRTVLSALFGREVFDKEYEASRDVAKVVFNDSEIWSCDPYRMKFSNAMRGDLIADWERWNAMTREAQMLSSASPGYQSKYFASWEDAVVYFGVEPFNPFENAMWVESRNSSGTDVPDVFTGELYHANVVFFGNEDGDVNYAGLTAGYSMKISTGILVSETTADSSNPILIVSQTNDNESYFIYREDQYLYAIGIDPDMQLKGSSGSIVIAIKSYMAEKNVRITFAAEPLSRLSNDAEIAGGKRYQYSSGVIFIASTERYRDRVNARIYYTYGGIHYTVTLYDLEDEAEAGIVIDHVINFIDKRIKNR